MVPMVQLHQNERHEPKVRLVAQHRPRMAAPAAGALPKSANRGGGLLRLRLNSHKITTLDCGHWHPFYAYAVGNDPGFGVRERNNSSILQDGQGLLLVNERSKILLARGDAIADGMTPQPLQCLQGNLRPLKARPVAIDRGLAYGFHCQAGERSLHQPD